MKILLIVPRFIDKHATYYDFPIGMAYISAALKRAGHEVQCLNLNNHQEKSERLVAMTVRKFHPDIIGTGGLSVHYRLIKAVIESARLVMPSLTVMVGGGIVSSEPELMLKALGADVGVLGEGEETVVKLMCAIEKGYDLTHVSGIIFKNIVGDEEKIVKTMEPPPISDLDSLPWPDYEGFGIKTRIDFEKITDRIYFNHIKQPRTIEMIASRSCPFDCSFCYHPLGKVYRERSLDNFFQELEYLVSTYGINNLMVLDELFAVKSERLTEFCRRIKSYDLKWVVQLRVDLVSEEILDLMKNSGCVSISYGIESMNEKVLIGMKKKITPVLIEQALELTYKKGIDIQGNLILGDTTETYESANDTINWWLKHRKYQIGLGTIQQYPGTKIYRDAIGKGVIVDKLNFIDSGCPTVNTTSMDDAVFFYILNWAILLNAVMTVPSKILSYKKLKAIDPLHGALCSIDCVCPHCGQINKFPALPIKETLFNRRTLRLSCCKCFKRFDIPKFIPKSSLDIIKSLTFDDIINAKALINAIKEIMTQSNAYYARANYLLGKIYYIIGDMPNALSYLSKAMLYDNSRPAYYKIFGDILRRLDRCDDAEIFYEQSKMIEAVVGELNN